MSGASAADAVELLPPQLVDGAFYGLPYHALLAFDLEYPQFVGGQSDYWWRVRAPGYSSLQAALVVYPHDGGTPGVQYSATVYRSSDADEDGSTLTQMFAEGPADLPVVAQGVVGTNALAPVDTAWFYFRLTPSVPLTTTDKHAVYVQVVGNTVWGDGSGTGGDYGNGNGGGDMVRGRTTVGIRAPDTVRGRTQVMVGYPATNDLADAHAIRFPGPGEVDVVWGARTMDARLEAPPITLNHGEQYTRVSWHKFQMPASGQLDISDEPTRAAAARSTGRGQYDGYGGTVMAVYSGPPNANYSDLVLLATSIPGAQGSNEAAHVEVTAATGTWIYVEHAYRCDPDFSPDLNARLMPEQLTSIVLGGGGIISGTPDAVVAQTRVAQYPYAPPLAVFGYTQVKATAAVIPQRAIGIPDVVTCATDVEVFVPNTFVGAPDPVVGSTALAAIGGTGAPPNPNDPTVDPPFGGNVPVTVTLSLTGTLVGELVLPDIPTFAHVVTERNQPGIIVTAVTPVIINGQPRYSPLGGRAPVAGTATQGPNHIRAIAPAPVWDGSGYVNPPPPTVKPWAARWVVDDLPDPPSGGYYWLGDPSSADGTRGISTSKRQWKAHGSTPHAPSWHSFYPFKPSVRAHDSFLPGGNVVHHPKGVHFNRDFIEHMWMDFGGARRQPFTWVIAGMVASYPSAHYEHYLLDSGRNPDSVRFPRLHDYDTSRGRAINDGLLYRNMLSYSPDHSALGARLSERSTGIVRARASSGISPRMFFGIFNGSNSYVGDYGTSGKRRAKGAISNGTAQQHRYYVLGRRNGRMDQNQASHLLIFEIRFWTYAMSLAELDEQYAQLSSTYHFNQYRRI